MALRRSLHIIEEGFSNEPISWLWRKKATQRMSFATAHTQKSTASMTKTGRIGKGKSFGFCFAVATVVFVLSAFGFLLYFM